ALYVDGGLREAVPSTIVDCRRGSAVVLREGVVSTDHVNQVATGEVQWGSRPADAEAPATEPSPAAAEPPNADGQA
ncbi:MAG: hypothetical protein M3R09_09025, partial [Actinomycetota bacterium]|nr:hypothetical protein [Actinomycetota bacterium]